MTLSTFQMNRSRPVVSGVSWGTAVSGGAECLPCIETGCPSAEVDGNDYCNVCWTESLMAAPCVKVCSCFKHMVQYSARVVGSGSLGVPSSRSCKANLSSQFVACRKTV